MEENGSTGPRLPQEGRIVWPGITIGVACSLLSRHITVNGRRSSDQDYYSHAMVDMGFHHFKYILQSLLRAILMVPNVLDNYSPSGNFFLNRSASAN